MSTKLSMRHFLPCMVAGTTVLMIGRSLPVGRAQDPLRLVNRLAEIRDGALSLLGGTDEAVTDGADDLIPGKADHARRRRIHVDDPMHCRIDDEDPRVDRIKEGLQILLLAGRHVFRDSGCLLDLDPHAVIPFR